MKPKIGSLKINKIDKSLARLLRKKKKQINKKMKVKTLLPTLQRWKGL